MKNSATLIETIRESVDCWCEAPKMYCDDTECQYYKAISRDEENAMISVLHSAQVSSELRLKTKAQIKELMAFQALSIDDLIDAYLYERRLHAVSAGDFDALFEGSAEIEAQYIPLKKAAEAYADTMELLDDTQRVKRAFLERHGGFIDLKKYQKAWVRKHGRFRSWTDAVNMAGDNNAAARRLAVMLDEISRLKAKARRLARQLRFLGKQAKGKSNSPLDDLVDLYNL